MKKLLSLLIAIIIVLSAVAACAAPADNNRDTDGANEPAGDLAGIGDNDSPTEKETESDEAGEDETTADETELPPDETVAPNEDAFTIENLDGYKFDILSYVPISNNMASCGNDFDEPSKEVYANAVYQRNYEVEQLLGVTISETTYDDAYAAYDEIRNAVLAAHEEYEMCFLSTSYALSLAAFGALENIDNLEHINLENSWWNSDCFEQLAIHGNHSILSGDLSVTDKEGLWAVYFNKDLIGSLDLENPYELVASGEWTLDKMHEMSTAAFSADANVTGLVTSNEHIIAGWASAGQKIVSLDENGKSVLSCGNDTFYNILSDIKSKISNDSVLIVSGTDSVAVSSSVASKMINEGTALFAENPIHTIGSMRSEDTSFGILPMPKYNIATEEYVSHVSYFFSTVAGIPVTAYDYYYEVGIVTEALAAKGKEIITPAYYDILLTSASGRDEESAPMLDLIFGNRSYDIGSLANFKNLSRSFIIESELSPSTIYKSRRKDIEKTLENNW